MNIKFERNGIPVFFFRLAFSCQNRYEQAVEAYKKAVELDPEQESYKNNLKIAEDKLKELEESFRQGQGPGVSFCSFSNVQFVRCQIPQDLLLISVVWLSDA